MAGELKNSWLKQFLSFYTANWNTGVIFLRVKMLKFNIHKNITFKLMNRGSQDFSTQITLHDMDCMCLCRTVFPILLFSSISLHWLLRKAFLSLLAILWNSAFKWEYLSFSPLLFASLLFRAVWRPPQTTILPFCISFPWGWSWSLSPIQCHEPLSIVHQVLYQI